MTRTVFHCLRWLRFLVAPFLGQDVERFFRFAFRPMMLQPGRLGKPPLIVMCCSKPPPWAVIFRWSSSPARLESIHCLVS
jgi:hypothetical protein